MNAVTNRLTGEFDYQGMLKQLDTGLLVIELMGQGVNMVTGDYSRRGGILGEKWRNSITG